MEFILRVSDNGCGMSSEQQKKIFRSFYTTKSDGTGLGLALSRRIIRKHGGELSVKSETDVGTRFTIHLPAKSASAVEDVMEARGSKHEL